MGTATERYCSQMYVNALVSLARKYGFGHVDRKLQRKTGEHAARYLGKYLTGGKNDTFVASETATRRDVPGNLSWVNPRLTRETNVTMASLRERRRCYYFACKIAREGKDSDARSNLCELYEKPPDTDLTQVLWEIYVRKKIRRDAELRALRAREREVIRDVVAAFDASYI